jgi:hypothetical protein
MQFFRASDGATMPKGHGLGVREAIMQERSNGRETLIQDGVAVATRFKGSHSRHSDFPKIR